MRRGKWILVTLIIGLLAISFSTAATQTNLNVNINIGPPTVISEPADVVMIPQTEVYYSPDNFDLFFFSGFWWAPRGNHWYRSRSYSGPWGVVKHREVPTTLIRVPKNYREISRRERHLSYKQFKRNYSERDNKRHRK